MLRSDQLRDLQLLTILVPALCAGLYESLRHWLLPSDLPFGLGTVLAVALVLAISYGFAHISFGMIRGAQARLRERNRELQALSREVERLAVLEERDRLAREIP
jgi:signal transduction histidine kinase